MKVSIMASGHLGLTKVYDIDSSSAVPNLGDTVVVNGTPLEVYERVFDFDLNPGEVKLLCKPKSHLS